MATQGLYPCLYTKTISSYGNEITVVNPYYYPWFVCIIIGASPTLAVVDGCSTVM